MSWIPTSERLPDDEQQVLIAILHEFDNAPWEYSLAEAYFVAPESESREPPRWSNGSGNDYQQPTHWMPFPESPAVPKKRSGKSLGRCVRVVGGNRSA